MSNGVKLGLLVVVAAALGVIAFKMVNANHDGIESRKEEPTLSTPNSAPGEVKVGKESEMRAKTTIQWEKTDHDFGTLKQGDNAEYAFKFTNTGSEPLIIEDAKGSCGCTIPQKPSGPIAPGASDVIKVKFNSANKSGKVTKNVTLTANTEPIQSILTIHAQVEVPAK